jgi:hypothetical protein
MFGSKHPTLERSAKVHADPVQPEPDVLTLQESGDVVGQ